MMTMKIKKGDQVVILSGNYKGIKGEVNRILPKKNKAYVQGVNIVKKHIKPNSENPKGKIIEKEAPIYLWKMAVLDPESGRPTRIGFQLKDGIKSRVAKRSGKILS